MSWYLAVLKRYAVFGGRARRKEYWYFFLFNLLILIVLAVIDGAIGAFNARGHIGLLSGLYSLAVLIPGLAVSVRRLHDTNRGGWWLLIALVPLIGAVVLVVFCAQESQPGENQYGPNPKTSPGASTSTLSFTMPDEQTTSASESAKPSDASVSASTLTPDRQDAHNAVAPRQQTEEPVATPVVFCTKCGAKNPADAKFCYSCGGLLFKPRSEGVSDVAASPAATPCTSASLAPQQASGDPGGLPANTPNGRYTWSNWDAAIVVLILIGLALFALLLLPAASRHAVDTASTTSIERSAVSSQASTPANNPFAGLFTPSSETRSQSSAATNTGCPSTLPAGVNSKLLSPEESKQVVGTKASLYSRDSDITDEYLNNLLMWDADLRFSNATNYCISSAEVELTLRHGKSSFRERHVVSFDPILSPSQADDERVHLHRRTKDYGEPLIIEGWEVTKIWGFHVTNP